MMKSLSESRRPIGAPRKAERKQVVKKNLSFEPATEESSSRSSVSEVVDAVYAANSPVVDTPASPSLYALSVTPFEELPPTSEITTDIQEDTKDTSIKHTHCSAQEYSDVKSVEVDIVVEQLKYLLLRILRSSAIDVDSKKLADILIKTVMEEFHGIHNETDLLSKIVRRKTHIVANCFILWMICTLVVVYINCYTVVLVPFAVPPPT